MKQEAHHPEAIAEAEIAEMAATCPCLNVRMAARAVTQVYDRALQPSGLRATQFSLLGAIALAGETTPTRLAEELIMDQTTLTRNLKLLENKGLIAVEAGTDRRTRMVTVTPAGHQAMAVALPLWRGVRARVIDQLGDAHWSALLTGLRAVTLLAEAD